LSVEEKSPYYLEQDKGAVFHAECWALTHYLLLKDHAEKTSKVAQYVSLVNQHVGPVAAAASVFGDLRTLQRNLEEYIRQRSFNYLETRIPINTDDSQFQVQAITAKQAQAVKADYLAASGRLEEARALSLPAERHASAEPAATRVAPTVEQPTLNGACRLGDILEAASERATEMVDNLQRFTATEEIEYTELRGRGKRERSTKQWFSYVANVEQGRSAAFWIEEYRLAKTQGDAAHLWDSKTATFALIFLLM
jgi:hypothetical protein